MKVRFFFNGKSIQSGHSEEIELEELGYSEEFWKSATDEEKSCVALDWACENGMEYGWQDMDDTDALAKQDAAKEGDE